jgi:hypothetical protein
LYNLPGGHGRQQNWPPRYWPSGHWVSVLVTFVLNSNISDLISVTRAVTLDKDPARKVSNCKRKPWREFYWFLNQATWEIGITWGKVNTGASSSYELITKKGTNTPTTQQQTTGSLSHTKNGRIMHGRIPIPFWGHLLPCVCWCSHLSSSNLSFLIY